MTTLIIAPDVLTGTTGDVPCLHDKNVGVVENAKENVGVVENAKESVGVVENDSKTNKRKLGEIDFRTKVGPSPKKSHPCPPMKSSKPGSADTNSKHSNSSKQDNNNSNSVAIAANYKIAPTDKSAPPTKQKGASRDLR